MRIMYFLLLMVLIHPASAQDSLKHQNDSLLNLKLAKQSLKVQQLAAENMADSLKRLELETRVTELKANDQLKRASLLKELADLKQNDSLRREKQKHQIDSLRRFAKGFRVAPFRDTLFYIFTRQGSFTPKDRAEAIAGRISKLSDDYGFRADSLKLLPSEQTVAIYYKNNLLVSVSEQDALWPLAVSCLGWL